MADSTPKQIPGDLIQRGLKKPSPAGTLTFIGLRFLDPILQYQLLAGGWGPALLSKVGVASAVSAGALTTGISSLDSLGLSLPQLVILSMATGSALKQVFWLLYLSKESFPAPAALAVAAFNTVSNSANTLLFLAAATSSLSQPKFPGTDIPYTVAIGAALYALGMSLETVSEYQRKVFKDSPESSGKVMRTGLWAWARHINYGGYALWRGAYSFAASGWIGGLAVGAFQASDFINRAIPVLDTYCTERYGEQWVSFKKDVRWALLPGIY